MQKLIVLLLLPLVGCGQKNFNGTFKSDNGDPVTTLTIQSKDGVVSGNCSEGDITFNVTGQSEGDAISGTLNETGSGIPVIEFEGSFHDDNTLNMTMRGGETQQNITFKRLQSGSSQQNYSERNNSKSPSAGGDRKLDHQLVGKWINEKITNSNNGSLTSQDIFIFKDNGVYLYYKSSFGFTGQFKIEPETNLVEQGTWYSSGDLCYYKADDKSEFGNFKYRINGNTLVTAEKVIWNREAN